MYSSHSQENEIQNLSQQLTIFIIFMKDNGENNVNFSFNIRCRTNANRFGTWLNQFTHGACFVPQLHNAQCL